VQNQLTIKEIALELGISREEFDLIEEKLGRIPNEFETYLFSAQWSEHCGYKHSKHYLKKINESYESENAGYVQIGGKAVVFKVESHNHPSAVEPYQGAATGIGGIVRDILAMGARPIALLDSLKFGNICDPKVKNIFEGVVSGISDYGNSIGVPTVGGETSFNEIYSTNPLVNVMCIGIANKNHLASSHADGPNRLLVYVGSKTGRDGIHGASFASKKLSGKDDRPSVQVGDPFTEKNLIEATLEILKIKGVRACQDMGAAGVLSSTSEMAYKGGVGCELYLDNIPKRQEDIEPWEIMLSESQERMLFLVNPGKEKEVEAVCNKYLIDFAVIGKTISTPHYVVKENSEGKVLADLPIDILVNAPEYYRNNTIPSTYILNKAKKYPKTKIKDIDKILKILLSNHNISSKKWIYQQYDYKVETNTIFIPEQADSAVLWLKKTQKAIAVTIDSNELYTYLDPFEGTKNVVYEAARNLISVGAKPLAITDNLNFGDPDDPEVSWQFEKSIEGLIEASKELSTPVVSGNVSFYNSYHETSIFPTPVIGMIGEIKDIKKIVNLKFKDCGDVVYLIGKTDINVDKIGGSFYLKVLEGFVGGEIDFVNPMYERYLQNFILDLIEKGISKSVHDVSKGGLLTALAVSCILSNRGFKGILDASIEGLFGENQGRFIVSVRSKDSRTFEDMAKSSNINFKKLGEIKSSDDGIDIGSAYFDLKELKSIYFDSISKSVEE
jgi:phosphoribosylformylglycinamidine synthase